MPYLIKHLRLIVLFTIFAMVFSTGYKIYIVYGNSMRPTHNTGRILVVDRNAYSLGKSHQRFDLVTINIDGENLVKRIIGLQQENVRIKDGVIYINNKVLDDDIYGEGLIGIPEGGGLRRYLLNYAAFDVPVGHV